MVPEWFPPLRDAFQFYGALASLPIILALVAVLIWQVCRGGERHGR